MSLRYELDQDQKETVEFALANPYSIIALEMGLGKTACAIAVKDRTASKCLVVCPSYLKFNWKKEINKFLPGQTITLFEKGKDVYYPFDSDFAIVSYDLAIKNPALFDWANMVVLDEATAIKELKSKRASEIHRLIYENAIPRVHPMTGTPIMNRVREFYSLIALMYYNPTLKDPEFLKRFTNDVAFAEQFSYKDEYEKFIGYKLIKITKWYGLRNENELKSWLRGIYIRKKSKMAPINYEAIIVDNFNDDELRELFDNYEEGVSRVAPQVKAMAALRKTPHTIKYVEDQIANGTIEGPVIIFTDHVEACKEMARHFGVTPITGETPIENRQKMADAFQEGSLPVLVATFGSFSTGYTLTASNFMIQNDYPWTPGAIAQAEMRINRKGQLRPCYVKRIFGSEQDEYIFQTIQDKQSVIDRVY